MKKLIIKVVHFLLRFVDSEVISFEKFYKDVEVLAEGVYFSATVEKSCHPNSEPGYTFTAYIANKASHISGSTPKEVFDKINNVKVVQKVKEVIN